MIPYFILLIINLYYVHANDLKVCYWYGKDGICIPKQDCHGKGVRLLWSCGSNICCLNPKITRNKCLEYQSKVYGNGTESKSNKSLPHLFHKIVGGEPVKKGEFPFMAAIGQVEEDKMEWVCGGSIISPKFILSAAHCFNLKKFKYWVLVGATSKGDSDKLSFPVAEVFLHPSYIDWKHHYDIALLRLEDSLPLSEGIHPICLMYEHEQQQLKEAIATGWGKLHRDAEDKQEEELNKVELDVIYIKTCKRFYPHLYKFGGFQPSMICAGNINGGMDTCQGDSGGPLFVQGEEERHFFGLIGITSIGFYGCGSANAPSLYTRPSYFLSWIARITWPTENFL